MSRKKDLTGKRFGRLTVIKDTGKRTNDGKVIWECKCDCGNIKEIIGTYITSKGYKSCGCLKKEGRKELFSSKDFQKKFNIGHKGANIKDITNLRSGLLVALKRTNKKSSNGCFLWECKCDCGKICYVSTRDITQKQKLSCGCLSCSHNEIIIKKMLDDHNIFYIKEYQIEKGYRFDFFIDNKYMLEYDGEQHFKEVKFFNKNKDFLKRRQDDLFKNHYCFKNNIPIIRIPYNKEYVFEDLLLESTRFLLTADNENKYYKERSEAEYV